MNRTEGIILNVIKFQESDQIITVFSSDHGIIKMIVKKSVLTPLIQAEFNYTQGRSDLLKCYEVSFINQHLSLRKKLSDLETACELMKAIQHSQLPSKPAAPIYLLLKSYLEKIPTANPEVLQASFYLKLLRYEGLLHISPLLCCTACGQEIKNYSFFSGDFFCREHSPIGAFLFTTEESNAILILSFARSFIDLNLLHFTSDFYEKIKKIFYSLI